MHSLRLKVIACKIMARQISAVIKDSPHFLDITTLRQSYHNTPSALRALLQEEIDRVESGNDCHSTEGDYDAILLGYGLCSNAVCGLKTKKTKLVIPIMHDCISLFLGSSSAYLDVFRQYPGTFFYNYSWAELAPDQGSGMLEQKRAEYMEKYQDEDYVEALMETEEMLLANYHGLAYIRWPEMNEEYMEARAQKHAEAHGWDYYRLDGSSTLLRKMLNGDWNPEEFLVLGPGQSVRATGDGRIITG